MRIALALIFTTLVTPVYAQRPDATRMTCQQAAALVQKNGAVVMGLGGERYDRVVRHDGFCERTQFTQPLFSPTLDNPACMIGWYCKEKEYYSTD